MMDWHSTASPSRVNSSLPVGLMVPSIRYMGGRPTVKYTSEAPFSTITDKY